MSGPKMSSAGWAYAVSVDTETTGLGADARIVQLAALRFRYRWEAGSSEPVVEFSPNYRMSTLVCPPPGTVFSPGAVRVTGIDADRVRGAPSFPDVAARFLEVVADLPAVAHNAPFDRRMVAGEFRAMRMGEPDIAWICSMAAARGAGHRRTALGDLCLSLGIRARGALHDADVDSELAARLYARLVRPHVPDRTLFAGSPAQMEGAGAPIPGTSGWAGVRTRS